MASVAAKSAAVDAEYGIVSGAFDLLRDELRHDFRHSFRNRHKCFGEYIVSDMVQELKEERPDVFPGQFIAVTISRTDAGGVAVQDVSLESPSGDVPGFADLTRVSGKQPLAWTEDPYKALAKMLQKPLDRVERLCLALHPGSKDPQSEYRFRMKMRRRDKVYWSKEWQKVVHILRAECPCLRTGQGFSKQEL